MKTAILITFLTFFLGSQSELKLDASNSTMTVAGTSTIHDWEEDVTDFTVKGKYTDGAIINLETSVVSKSIESGKSIMDDKTYEALKAEKFPNITFKASNLAINGDKVTGTGNLSLAGVTKQIPITASVKTVGNSLEVQGEIAITMSDYKIDPPTAMFGSVKCGDDVTISYKVLLNK